MTTTGNNQQQHPDEGVVAASYKSALLHRLWIQSSATAARRRITTLSSLLPSLLLLFKERILPAPSPLWNPRYLSDTIYLLLQIGIMRIIRSSSGILQFPLPGGGGGSEGEEERARGWIDSGSLHWLNHRKKIRFGCVCCKMIHFRIPVFRNSLGILVEDYSKILAILREGAVATFDLSYLLHHFRSSWDSFLGILSLVPL